MIFEVDLAAINSFEYESTWIADPHHTLLAYRKGKRYVIVICLKGVPSQPAIKGMPNGHGLPVHSVVCENFRHFSEAWHLFSSACPLVQYPEEMRRSAIPDVKPTNIVEFRPPGQRSCTANTDRSA
jgi:hypothetical protein